MHCRPVAGPKRFARRSRSMGRCNVYYLDLFFFLIIILFSFNPPQGKDLFMDLDEGALKLIDPENLTILNTQPIHTIRVWGVGRDNGRYVCVFDFWFFLVRCY